MDWSRDSLYNKAKLFVRRAHNEDIESALFGFWISLSLELLARSSLSQIHPALLADPKEPDNIQYAFGKTPKGVPKSIAAKALYSRCSIFIDGFTDMMAGHCLVMADRRNSELHTGAAIFESIETSSWLAQTYEVMDTLLNHLKLSFSDFVGDEHKAFAVDMLKDRRDNIKKEVLDKISAAKQYFEKQTLEWKAERLATTTLTRDSWIAQSRLRKVAPVRLADQRLLWAARASVEDRPESTKYLVPYRERFAFSRIQYFARFLAYLSQVISR